ncbi:hypothetical protein [Luteipulveratus halotolerans]|uniref:Uncharacterized protein n=1 Tax=Luteipulveratus halotolerans TaxID=1631356 RepID=A0A0L6CEK8_9MICO|nr:hypothetical protein [Luteipulveratus halotolerans]KNX36247.1 hypothetical protein VV01_02360 [Luteipulveratus halotolerans]
MTTTPAPQPTSTRSGTADKISAFVLGVLQLVISYGTFMVCALSFGMSSDSCSSEAVCDRIEQSASYATGLVALSIVVAGAVCAFGLDRAERRGTPRAVWPAYGIAIVIGSAVVGSLIMSVAIP